MIRLRFGSRQSEGGQVRRAVPNGCGCSSAVEHDLAKVGVEGSIPFARSSFFKKLAKKTEAAQIFFGSTEPKSRFYAAIAALLFHEKTTEMHVIESKIRYEFSLHIR